MKNVKQIGALLAIMIVSVALIAGAVGCDNSTGGGGGGGYTGDDGPVDSGLTGRGGSGGVGGLNNGSGGGTTPLNDGALVAWYGDIVFGTPTQTTVTITSGEVRAVSNPGNQDFEYALGTSTAPVTGWKDGTYNRMVNLVFTTLKPSTTYYVWGRSKANTGYRAGVAVPYTTASITTYNYPSDPGEAKNAVDSKITEFFSGSVGENDWTEIYEVNAAISNLEEVISKMPAGSDKVAKEEELADQIAEFKGKIEDEIVAQDVVDWLKETVPVYGESDKGDPSDNGTTSQTENIYLTVDLGITKDNAAQYLNLEDGWKVVDVIKYGTGYEVLIQYQIGSNQANWVVHAVVISPVAIYKVVWVNAVSVDEVKVKYPNFDPDDINSLIYTNEDTHGATRRTAQGNTTTSSGSVFSDERLKVLTGAAKNAFEGKTTVKVTEGSKKIKSFTIDNGPDLLPNAPITATNGNGSYYISGGNLTAGVTEITIVNADIRTYTFRVE